MPGRAETLLGRAVCALERSWNVPRALWDVAVARARGKVEVNFLVIKSGPFRREYGKTIERDGVWEFRKCSRALWDAAGGAL